MAGFQLAKTCRRQAEMLASWGDFSADGLGMMAHGETVGREYL